MLQKLKMSCVDGFIVIIYKQPTFYIIHKILFWNLWPLIFVKFRLEILDVDNVDLTDLSSYYIIVITY